MVLPAPPAHASPVAPHWVDRLVVAIELSSRGVLTLVDQAAPARLREAYLQLRARDPAIEVVVDVRGVAELSPGTTAILVLEPSIRDDELDWLNLNRPVISDRRLSIVLWCEEGAAAALARRAPDFFDWISARVDCPPAPAAHAVADVKRAICARASGIAWDGPGLEETLAAVRPGRLIRRVKVASYRSMIDALTSREPGWLFLDGIETAFHLRRLRWAMAETGRRVIVFRRAFEQAAPGWWTVHARHVPIPEAVHALVAAGGTGRLAALTGLDPDACAYARSLLSGFEAARLEELLATTSDPRAALRRLAQQTGWALDSEAAGQEQADDPVVLALHGRPSRYPLWAVIGKAASDAGDFEVAIRWFTAALRSLPQDAPPLLLLGLFMLRGGAHRSAGEIAPARLDFERAYPIARDTGDASTIVDVSTDLGEVLLKQGEPSRAREYLESALSASSELGDTAQVALLLGVLAGSLMAQGDLAGARRQLERALSIQERVIATEEHPDIAATLITLGVVLAEQGDVEGARSYLERSLEIGERSGGPHHPIVVVALRALAGVHRALSDTRGAHAYLELALAAQRIALGSDDHPDIAETLVELARVLAADGDLEGAQATLERALAIQHKVFGDEGRLAGATTRRTLAEVLVAKGDLVGAIEHLSRALATLRETFERDDHPAIVETLGELERLRKLQGELQRTD